MKRDRIDLAALKSVFNMPLHEAAKKLGCCATYMKNRCRVLGIERWPYRQLGREEKAKRKAGITNDTGRAEEADGEADDEIPEVCRAKKPKAAPRTVTRGAAATTIADPGLLDLEGAALIDALEAGTLLRPKPKRASATNSFGAVNSFGEMYHILPPVPTGQQGPVGVPAGQSVHTFPVVPVVPEAPVAPCPRALPGTAPSPKGAMGPHPPCALGPHPAMVDTVAEAKLGKGNGGRRPSSREA